jgi:hypothetical protein
MTLQSDDAEPNAIRWNGRSIEGGPPTWLHEAIHNTGTPDKTVNAAMRLHDEVHIGTKFGVMVAHSGDWIVRSDDGDIAVLTPYEHSLKRS